MNELAEKLKGHFETRAQEGDSDAQEMSSRLEQSQRRLESRDRLMDKSARIVAEWTFKLMVGRIEADQSTDEAMRYERLCARARRKHLGWLIGRVEKRVAAEAVPRKVLREVERRFMAKNKDDVEDAAERFLGRV